jgi:polyphenol oxidase
MISVALNGLSVLQYHNLSHFPELLHFSTIRGGGSSTGNYTSLNLGLNSGDEREKVLQNRNYLCSALGISGDRLLFPKQTHTTTVKVIKDSFLTASVEDQKSYLTETDAIITGLRGICVAVKTADCVPVLLYDPKLKVVAAIHAGWRGTAQGIVSETIRVMAEEFGTSPSDLVAGIGPSISPEVYEVGADVYSQFDPRFCNETNPFREEKRVLDLWKANREQLLCAGVLPDQVETARICTLSDPERFFSARRDGARTGRMGSGIMMK